MFGLDCEHPAMVLIVVFLSFFSGVLFKYLFDVQKKRDNGGVVNDG